MLNIIKLFLWIACDCTKLFYLFFHFRFNDTNQ